MAKTSMASLSYVALACEPHRVRSNYSLKLTRYGMRRLTAPGRSSHFPSAAKQRTPPHQENRRTAKGRSR
jgi:hypothetical protein